MGTNGKSWEEELSKYFPGSKTPRNFREIQETREEERDKWDKKPFIFSVGGKEAEFFSVGQLGSALGGRSSNTIRAWERTAVIPRSPYSKAGATVNGRRRMYTRAMVQGMVDIARSEGVLYPDKGKKLSETRFTERVFDLFQRLIKEGV